MALDHSPADIICSYLVEEGVVSDGGVIPRGDWPCFVSIMPAEEDLAVLIADTGGKSDGRLMSGKVIDHPGIQIMVRANDYRTAWRKVNDLDALFETLSMVDVTLEASVYKIASVSRQGHISYLGSEKILGRARIEKESENNREILYLNALTTIIQTA